MSELGQRLRTQLVELSTPPIDNLLASGPGPVFHLGFVHRGIATSNATRPVRNYRDVIGVYNMERYARFVRGMASRGVRLIGRGIWYISTTHTARDVELTVEAARQTLAEMAGQ